MRGWLQQASDVQQPRQHIHLHHVADSQGLGLPDLPLGGRVQEGRPRVCTTMDHSQILRNPRAAIAHGSLKYRRYRPTIKIPG